LAVGILSAVQIAEDAVKNPLHSIPSLQPGVGPKTGRYSVATLKKRIKITFIKLLKLKQNKNSQRIKIKKEN